jgi:single-strand DNA-binding protein
MRHDRILSQTQKFLAMQTQTNYVQLTGNLGKDVQMMTFDNGKKKASFSLATTSSYKNPKGEEVTNTTWHNIVAWGNIADIASNYKKGARVEIKGSINNRSYKDKDGNTKYITEINCYECKAMSASSESAAMDSFDMAR